MKKTVAFTVGAFVAGMLVSGMLVWFLMPSMMIDIHESKYDFEKTVSVLESSIKSNGWKLPKIYDFQASLQKSGFSDMTKMKVFSLCHPGHAYKILKNDSDKFVSGIMPCRVSVYEDRQGKVFVAGMNIGLMSQMFGGNIEKVMGDVSREEHRILQDILVN